MCRRGKERQEKVGAEDVMKDVGRSVKRSRYFPGRLTFGLFHGHFPTPFIPKALFKSYNNRAINLNKIHTACFFFFSSSMAQNVTQDSDVLMSWLSDEVTDSALCGTTAGLSSNRKSRVVVCEGGSVSACVTSSGVKISHA